MKRRDSIVANMDWVAVGVYLALVIIGWLNVFAVTFDPDESFFRLREPNPGFLQLVWIFATFLIVALVFFLDSRFFSFLAYPFYGFVIVLLLSVFVIGTTIHGAKSWIVLGVFSLQPAEFAKLATALALAKFMSAYSYKITRFKDLIITFAILGVPALLVLAQPDFGSFLIFTAFLLMLYREGLPGWVLVIVGSLAVIFLTTLILHHHHLIHIMLIVQAAIALLVYTILARKPLVLLLFIVLTVFLVAGVYSLLTYDLIKPDKEKMVWLVLGVLLILALIFGIKRKSKDIFVVIAFLLLSVGFTYSVVTVFDQLPDHHQKRINLTLGLITEKQESGYNLEQSLIAIGSGRIIGQGFLKGTQTRGDFVPQQRTDFIFSSVGEQFGFLGSIGLIILYSVLLIRLVIIAERQRSHFSRIYGYGVFSVLFLHFAFNIGMATGIFPTIGIPLIYISYGGSSFLACSLMLFILIRLDASRKTYLV